jgi:hypothetical protein
MWLIFVGFWVLQCCLFGLEAELSGGNHFGDGLKQMGLCFGSEAAVLK